MSSAVYPLSPDRRWRYVEHRSRKDMILGVLVHLRLHPRKEMWLLGKVEERVRNMPFEDAVYFSLREMDYSDRAARLVILTGRRTDTGDGRKDRALGHAARRLQELRSRRA